VAIEYDKVVSYLYLFSDWYEAGALGKKGSITLRLASLITCRCGSAMSF
jgi:hypothetical protein